MLFAGFDFFLGFFFFVYFVSSFLLSVLFVAFVCLYSVCLCAPFASGREALCHTYSSPSVRSPLSAGLVDHAGKLDNRALDLCSATDTLLRPDIVLLVAEQIDECDQKTPWMRTSGNQSLNDDAKNLLLNQIHSTPVALVNWDQEERQDQGGEEARVAIGESQLVNKGVDKIITALVVHSVRHRVIELKCWAVEGILRLGVRQRELLDSDGNHNAVNSGNIPTSAAESVALNKTINEARYFVLGGAP